MMSRLKTAIRRVKDAPGWLVVAYLDGTPMVRVGRFETRQAAASMFQDVIKRSG
jgi:hypothetical protein